MHKTRILTTYAVLTLLLFSSTAIQVHAQGSLEEFATSLPEETKRKITRLGKAAFIRTAAQTLFQLSSDGTVTREAIDISQQSQAANQRASFLSRFLRYDLNGDLEISRAEVDQQADLIRHRDRAEIELGFVEYDIDKNDSITLEELSAASKTTTKMRSRNATEELLVFDFNGDQQVDLVELAKVVSALGEEIPTARPTGNREAETLSCSAPKVQDGHALTLLTGYEGGALSTVAVNGQSTETRATTVTIEEGDGPLYLFLASFSPIVWDFDGAVDRIKTVVVQRPSGELFGPGVAIAGVKEDIVHYVDPNSCIAKIPTKDGIDIQRTSLQLAESLGISVAHAKAKYVLQDLQLPSGTINEQRREAAMKWYHGARHLSSVIRATSWRRA